MSVEIGQKWKEKGNLGRKMVKIQLAKLGRKWYPYSL